MSASNSSPGAFFYVLVFAVLSLGAVFLLKDYSVPEGLTAKVQTGESSPEATALLDKGGAKPAECIEGYRQFVIARELYREFPPSHTIEKLREMGLAHPVRDLKADLKRHPELIPHKGTLGGTMGFGFPEKTYVLDSQWVLAYFEDGHIGGFALLKFAVTKKGVISWKTVDAFLY